MQNDIAKAIAIVETELKTVRADKRYMTAFSRPVTIHPTIARTLVNHILALRKELDEARSANLRTQGMVMAAGIIMYCWGDETHASEILNAAGMHSVEDLIASGVDEYDINLVTSALRPLTSSIRAIAHATQGKVDEE